MKPRVTPAMIFLLYFVAWLPLFVLYTAGMRQTAAPTWPIAMMYAGSYLVPAVLLGFGWVKVWSRRPWRTWSLGRILLTELVAGVIYIALWHLLFVGYIYAVAGREAAMGLVRGMAGWQLLYACLVVSLHQAVFHALRIFRDLKAQEVAAAEAETLRARAEMTALRGQLDPHFLFNSLHSITALVREDPVKAEDALLQFAALLRRVLAIKRDSADEVPLGDEMRFVADYLAIERLRLGERLRVSVDIAPAAQACRLPAFSVQPLVENAIRHAIAPRRDGGRIAIRAGVKDGRLEIVVSDDGAGAEPAAVAQATGVGLSVIRQRLALRHGERAAVAVETAPGKGFRVTLALPAETEEVLA